MVPDFIGHGASAGWLEPKPFSFQYDVDALVELLRSKGQVHIVGHSYGAFVALIAALAIPEAVRSLTLFEPVAFGCLDPSADADARVDLDRVDFSWGTSASDHERWLRMFVEFWGGEGAWAALREEARAEFRRVGWVVREGVRTLAEDRTPASAYSVLRCPVSLVRGERSPVAASRVVQRLGESFSNARVITIPKAGHMAPLTHAALVSDIVFAALASSDSASPRGQ